MALRAAPACLGSLLKRPKGGGKRDHGPRTRPRPTVGPRGRGDRALVRSRTMLHSSQSQPRRGRISTGGIRVRFAAEVVRQETPAAAKIGQGLPTPTGGLLALSHLWPSIPLGSQRFFRCGRWRARAWGGLAEPSSGIGAVVGAWSHRAHAEVGRCSWVGGRVKLLRPHLKPIRGWASSVTAAATLWQGSTKRSARSPKARP